MWRTKRSVKVILYSTRSYEIDHFEESNRRNGFRMNMRYLNCRLNKNTVGDSFGYDVVCSFVHDVIDKNVLDLLFKNGVKMVALRCSGFDHVDLDHARGIGIHVTYAPDYSPESIAEYTVLLILYASRKLYLSLEGGEISEVGRTLKEQVVGVVGAGKIGSVVLKMISGFGSKLLACDPIVNLDIVQRYGVTYVGMDEILKSSDVISLNCPLNEDNYHLINDDACKIMKYGAILVNTGRGELVDSIAVLSAMKSKKIRCFCTDVIEKEHILMKQKVSDVFQNREEHQIYTTFRSLKRQKNFLFTGHKAFLTQTSLMNIADITLHNIDNFKNGRPLKYQLT